MPEGLSAVWGSVMKIAVRRLLLSPPVDADVVSWKSRVNAAGGTVSSATVSALTRFTKACKSAGVWDKLSRVNLFCGDQLTAALVPLKVGSGSATDTNVNFVSGDYTEATGITGNGSSKLISTGLLASSLTYTDVHLALYVSGRETVPTRGFIGNTDAASASAPIFMLYIGGSPTSASLGQNNTTPTNCSIAVAGSASCFEVMSSRSATLTTLYRNGASVGTNTATKTGMSSGVIELFCVSYGTTGTPSSRSLYSGMTGRGYSIGTGLTASEVAAYNTIMEQFQDALGRGVQ